MRKWISVAFLAFALPLLAVACKTESTEDSMFPTGTSGISSSTASSGSSVPSNPSSGSGGTTPPPSSSGETACSVIQPEFARTKDSLRTNGLQFWVTAYGSSTTGEPVYARYWYPERHKQKLGDKPVGQEFTYRFDSPGKKRVQIDLEIDRNGDGNADVQCDRMSIDFELKEETPPPTPAPLTCSGPEAVNVHQEATFTSNKSGNWIGGGKPANGSGTSFSTVFDDPGSKSVTVSAGGQSATCTVNVRPRECQSLGVNAEGPNNLRFHSQSGEYQFEMSCDGVDPFDTLKHFVNGTERGPIAPRVSSSTIKIKGKTEKQKVTLKCVATDGPTTCENKEEFWLDAIAPPCACSNPGIWPSTPDVREGYAYVSFSWGESCKDGRPTFEFDSKSAPAELVNGDGYNFATYRVKLDNCEQKLKGNAVFAVCEGPPKKKSFNVTIPAK